VKVLDALAAGASARAGAHGANAGVDAEHLKGLTMLRTLLAATALVGLMSGICGTVGAQTDDYRTYFTFSAPVTLPGVTLPAGRYLFRLADPTTGRKVISVLSADGTPLAMLHTIPNQLTRAPQDAEVRFMETPANMPPAIKTWWYPGKSIGYEFIYPRQQALQLAKVTPEPVLTTSTETTDFEKAELARISAAGVPVPVTVLETPPPVIPSGRAQQGEVAAAGGTSAPSVVAQAPQADERARSTARTELPQTASLLPTAALFGLLAILAGVGVSLWRRPRVLG
jgi:hypothetical protein